MNFSTLFIVDTILCNFGVFTWLQKWRWF